MRWCGGPFCFFLFCMRATPAQTPISSNFSTILSSSHLLHRVISFVLLCYSRCGRSCILHFCIHFLPTGLWSDSSRRTGSKGSFSSHHLCWTSVSPRTGCYRGRISSMDHQERTVTSRWVSSGFSPLHAVFVLLSCWPLPLQVWMAQSVERVDI